MTAEYVYNWTYFVLNSILTGAFAWTLYKVWQGKRFSVIIAMTVLLLLCNLLFTFSSIGQWEYN